jgi:uncharacterized protein
MTPVVKGGTALITGGSSGIGYAIAHELAHMGYNLVLVSNQELKLNEVCEEIALKYKVMSWPLYMDLALPGAAVKLYDWCQLKTLQVDVLVNNAGIFFFGEVVETSLEKAEKMVSLHTTTPALLCLLFGKDMKQRRSGHILNISSLAADIPYPGIAFYSSTKRFLKSFSRSLRSEMIAYNVNVTCICPGAVSTHLYELGEAEHKKALRTGIMMRADILAHLAVSAMFHRKSTLTPGFINRIFLFFIYLIPHGLIVLIRRHSKLLPVDKE